MGNAFGDSLQRAGVGPEQYVAAKSFAQFDHVHVLEGGLFGCTISSAAGQFRHLRDE